MLQSDVTGHHVCFLYKIERMFRMHAAQVRMELMLPSGLCCVGYHYIRIAGYQFIEDALIIGVSNYRCMRQMTTVEALVGSAWGSDHANAGLVYICKS